MQVVSLWDDQETTLPTPEQVDLRLETSNVGSRGLALLIDAAIRYGTLLLLYIIFVLTQEISGGGSLFELSRRGFLIVLLVLVLGSEWLYFTVLEWAMNGQTPGKRCLRLRVIRLDGSPVGILEVLARNVVRPLDSVGPMALIGMAFIFLHPRGQRIGDLLAGTMVVHERKIDWDLFSMPEESTVGLTVTRVRLAPLELEMLQRYRHRAAALDPATRERIAGEVKGMLQPRLQGTDLEKSSLTASDWVAEVARRI